MENASKALLITTGVLIATIIITIGIKIFSPTSETDKIASKTGSDISEKTAEATQIVTGEISGKSSNSKTAESIQQAPEQITEKPWIDNNNGSYTRDGVTVKIGDYVNYNHQKDANGNNINIEYTSQKDKTKYYKDGKYNDQFFSTNSTIEGWRVLGINNNGQLELMATNLVGTKDNQMYGLNYGDGYLNGVSELNKACAIFGKGKGAVSARSMNIGDIEKVSGINSDEDRNKNNGSYGDKYQYRFPTEEEKIGDTRYMQYRTLKFGQTQWSEWKNITRSWTQSFEMRDSSNIKLSINSPGTIELINTVNPLSLWNNLKIKGKSYIYDMIKVQNDRCWIASIYTDCGNREYVFFGIYQLNGDYVSNVRLCGSYSVGYGSNSNGTANIRPVVELSNKAELEWNNNTNKFDIK